jgi:hypothetical protein
MLARILFNLSFVLSLLVGVIFAMSLGWAYALPAAAATFLLGLLFTFVIGMIKGAANAMA